MKRTLLLMLFASVASPGHAQLLDNYDANSLATGSITSWSPLVGTDVASTSNFAGLLDPTVANTDPIFNGNNYVYFGVKTGLATTGSIIGGSSPRTLAVVYATTGAPTVTAPIAGVTQFVAPTDSTKNGTWFDLQSRNNVVTGDPYLAGFAADLSNGQAPAAERLTFALATYDGTTETLYWVYGTSLTATINSVSTTLALNTTGQFDFGFDPEDEPSPGQLELGSVLVYNTSMAQTLAESEIRALQTEYSAAPVPEPCTWAMLFGGLGSLVVVLRLRRTQVL